MKRSTPMKRTGFKPPVFVAFVREKRAPAPIACIRVPRPSAAVFRPTPKAVYLRDESYRRFVASLPCFACGRAGRSQAAHSNQAGAGKGLSIKASDSSLFPLCADEPGALGCHARHDRLIGMTLDVRKALEVTYLARMAALQLELA